MKIEKAKIDNFTSYRKTWDKSCVKAEILTDFPLHMDIELTSDCNLRCVRCVGNIKIQMLFLGA